MAINLTKSQLIKELYLKGISQKKISHILKVSQSSISRHIKLIKSTKIENNIDDIEIYNKDNDKLEIDRFKTKIAEFIEKFFSDQDYKKVSPTQKLNFQVKLIEILNKK